MNRSGSQLWRALNVLQRVAGFGAAGAGIIFGGWVITSHPRLERFAVLAVAAVLLCLSAVLLRARPFRPDLGDSLAAGHDLGPRQATDPQRRWWTGDPLI